MHLISSTDALHTFCTEIRPTDFVTVDTEFMREKTYYSQLCLVQVASPDRAALIDPLAPGIDLAPLLDLMRDKAVVKVFHAARQDIEIFYRLMEEVPTPLFDSQIAAMACGHGDQIGYEPLVRAVTGAQVDKGSRFTDWSKRPLTDKQLTYALGDVTHLVDVYLALKKQLQDTGRDPWVAEEMAVLNEPTLYFTAPERAWQRLKLRHVKPKEMGVLIEAAAWREREAQTKDLPRSRVLKDDAIVELSRAAPSSREELGALRAIPNGFERSRAADGLLQAIAKGRSIPRDELPKIVRNGPVDPAPPDVVDLLRVLLKKQCEQMGVAPKLLASAADLDAIARDDNADVPAMTGWRRDIFGSLALQLKHGEIALSLSGTEVSVINTPPDQT